MPALERTLGLLDLFTPETPVWTSEALIEFLDGASSTGYRHIKALQSAGLLTRVGAGSYMLGPRVLELDRTVRLSDPVYIAGSPVIRDLHQRTGHSAVLSILYSDSVVCVRRELSADGPPQLFSRGQKRTLVAGASAKAILAHLPAHQLRRIFQKHTAAIGVAGLGLSWDEFRTRLKAIRDAGFVQTRAEFQPGIESIAAPIFNSKNEVLGSLMLAISTEHPNLARFAAFAPDVIKAAQAATKRIANLDGAAALPARAVG
jgi:DNA-binding IclR family transcriptional regulator